MKNNAAQDADEQKFLGSWFPCFRSDALRELLIAGCRRRSPGNGNHNALVLLLYINLTAQYTDKPNARNLKQGQAQLGRHLVERDLGLSHQQYRDALEYLQRINEVRVIETSPSTIVEVIKAGIFAPFFGYKNKVGTTLEQGKNKVGTPSNKSQKGKKAEKAERDRQTALRAGELFVGLENSQQDKLLRQWQKEIVGCTEECLERFIAYNTTGRGSFAQLKDVKASLASFWLGGKSTGF